MIWEVRILDSSLKAVCFDGCGGLRAYLLTFGSVRSWFLRGRVFKSTSESHVSFPPLIMAM